MQNRLFFSLINKKIMFFLMVMGKPAVGSSAGLGKFPDPEAYVG
jgi:hypothetical protein